MQDRQPSDRVANATTASSSSSRRSFCAGAAAVSAGAAAVAVLPRVTPSEVVAAEPARVAPEKDDDVLVDDLDTDEDLLTPGVADDAELDDELLEEDADDTVSLDDVLLAGDGGEVKDAKGLVVSAEIIAQERGEKVIVFKKKRRQGYQVKKGHRQMYTALTIETITA